MDEVKLKRRYAQQNRVSNHTHKTNNSFWITGRVFAYLLIARRTGNTHCSVVVCVVMRQTHGLGGHSRQQTPFKSCPSSVKTPCANVGLRSATPHNSSSSSRRKHQGDPGQPFRASTVTRVTRGAIATKEAANRMVQPTIGVDTWFYSEVGQKDW